MTLQGGQLDQDGHDLHNCVERVDVLLGGAVVRAAAGVGGLEMLDLPDALADEVVGEVDEGSPCRCQSEFKWLNCTYMALKTLHTPPDLPQTHPAMNRDTWARERTSRRHR